MSYSDTTQLPEPLRALVQAEVPFGERVTWLDQPIPRRFARSTLPLVLFAIPWTAFSMFWIVAAAAGTAQSTDPGVSQAFPLFGVPFVLIGLGLFTSPFWARRAAARTVYVLTDRRAIVIGSAWVGGGVSVRSFEPAALSDLSRTQHADGSGDLVFAEDVHQDNKGRERVTEVGFLGVADVRSVEERVRALARRD